MALQTGGLLIALEHRFYGQSMPFGNNSLDLDKLKYLNSEQALSDIAEFIQTIKVSEKHGVKKDSKWIVIGGSYAGAMAGWFRLKYPHLSAGAIGSSGVILAV